MTWKGEWQKLALAAGIFLACFYLPADSAALRGAVAEALELVRWYARAHVLLCLVPALLIAGAIAAFVSQGAVMKYLGARANKLLAYGVASVSGSVLAVCSCTVLPLFAGIYRMGAGLGPAAAFLYAGPAINVLAIVLTARILGPELGVARAVGAVAFSIVIGATMHFIYRREEADKAVAQLAMPVEPAPRPLWQTALPMAAMVGILVFANWARSGDVRAVFLCCPNGLATYRVEGSVVRQDAAGVVVRDTAGLEHTIPAAQLQGLEDVSPGAADHFVYGSRWLLTAALVGVLALMLWRWYRRRELGEWVSQSWSLAKQILPLLLIGVLVAGFLLGRPGRDGIIPGKYVEMLVGARPEVFLAQAHLAGGSAEGAVRAVWPVWTNFFASVFGAFMYFATLTEVPILQGLIGSGMGKGPALALLLAGPALSLPNMLVIAGVMGVRKTAVYVTLVVVMATVSGLVFGAIAG